jgi:hypothetical protein
MKQEVKPLFIFVWENIYWCTDKYNEVPLTAGSVVLHTTKETVEYYLNNPLEIKDAYPDVFRSACDKYRQKITHLIDYPLYNLRDVNGNECDVSD